MKEALIIDLEMTCCDDSSIPEEERETIEIGAVLMSLPDGKVLSEFQSVVRPVRHPRLTEICIKVTGIVQSEVDGSREFPSVWNDGFLPWLGDRDSFCS